VTCDRIPAQQQEKGSYPFALLLRKQPCFDDGDGDV